MKIKSSNDGWHRRKYILTRKGVTAIISIIVILLITILLLSFSKLQLKKEIVTYSTTIENLQTEVVYLKQQNNDLVSEISDLVSHNEYLTSQSDRLSEMLNEKTLSINSEEFKLLAKVVYCESNAEPYEGQVAVARVILNRWIGNKWDDNSIKDVIYRPGQFNQILDKIDDVIPTATNYCAVVDAINNTINMPVDVDSFETISSGTQNGSSYKKWRTIGRHNFNILKKG